MIDYDDSKAAELILHIAKQTEKDESAGATKLDKISYFAELAHLRRFGVPIIGAEYQKLEQGPALRRMLPIIERLESEGAAKLVERGYYGQRQKRLLALRDPDLSQFSAEEIASIDTVIRQAWGESATRISERSHEDAGWLAVVEGETILLTLAFIAEPEISDSMRQRARQLVARVTDA